MMLGDVERSLISIKHRLQHRPTFLLFSGVNNVTFVWSLYSTLMNARMPTKVTLRVSISMAMTYCLHLLHSLSREYSSYSMANEQSFESLND